jgi:hypothetical protein
LREDRPTETTLFASPFAGKAVRPAVPKDEQSHERQISDLPMRLDKKGHPSTKLEEMPCWNGKRMSGVQIVVSWMSLSVKLPLESTGKLADE